AKHFNDIQGWLGRGVGKAKSRQRGVGFVPGTLAFAVGRGEMIWKRVLVDLARLSARYRRMSPAREQIMFWRKRPRARLAFMPAAPYICHERSAHRTTGGFYGASD